MGGNGRTLHAAKALCTYRNGEGGEHLLRMSPDLAYDYSIAEEPMENRMKKKIQLRYIFTCVRLL